jgi:hypothetical protein
MKTMYHQTFKRVVRNGRVKYGPWQYHFPPTIDVSRLEGISITVEKRGTEKGTYDMQVLWYCPTPIERELIGLDRLTFFIPLV